MQCGIGIERSGPVVTQNGVGSVNRRDSVSARSRHDQIYAIVDIDDIVVIGVPGCTGQRQSFGSEIPRCLVTDHAIVAISDFNCVGTRSGNDSAFAAIQRDGVIATVRPFVRRSGLQFAIGTEHGGPVVTQNGVGSIKYRDEISTRARHDQIRSAIDANVIDVIVVPGCTGQSGGSDGPRSLITGHPVLSINHCDRINASSGNRGIVTAIQRDGVIAAVRLVVRRSGLQFAIGTKHGGPVVTQNGVGSIKYRDEIAARSCYDNICSAINTNIIVVFVVAG